MHQEIRHNLEDYLKGSAPELPAEFNSHLGECGECSDEVRLLEAQSQLLRSLRSPRDIEPRAGFYARVLERIEAQPASIWSVFLDRKFGFRLALASAALVALLGTYLVTSEPSGPEFASSPAVVHTDTLGTTEASLRAAEEDGSRQQQQRDAVLVDLASYHQ
jgi:predicted anti-sigma-YlaC factor YlaD